MSADNDQRFGELFGAIAPPARDPVFRLQVLERRERRRFQRRLFSMLLGTLAILLVSTFAVGMGAAALETTGALAAGGALAIVYPAFRFSLPRILRRLSP